MKQEKDLKTLPEKAYKLGFEYERSYRGCGQCTVAALQDTFGMRNDDIFKSITGLAGGAGMLCNVGCGGYIGGSIFLGSLLGRERDNFADPEGIRFKTHELVRKLYDKFIDEYGTAICRDIQMKLFGRYYYLPDEDEFTKFHNAGAHDKICPEVVANSAKWVAEIIIDENLLPEG